MCAACVMSSVNYSLNEDINKRFLMCVSVMCVHELLSTQICFACLYK